MSVVVVGGCGHVGLPLALVLADAGVTVAALDVDHDKVAQVNSGQMPFIEGGDPEALLRSGLASGRFLATTDPQAIAAADTIVIVIGTPVDEHLNPDPNAVTRALQDCIPYMHDGQLVILRSTVYPGVTKRVEAAFRESGLTVDVACCPERIAEGHALTELRTLPQLVGSRSSEVFERASALFRAMGVETVQLDTEEAELAKLVTNVWRYIKFAAANQFWMMANDAGLDFSRILAGLKHNYPRATDMPGAGFAAGPCLLKDTMQLAAFTNNTFLLGHSAMLVNEGMPLYLVGRLEQQYDIESMTVGILGMAFKGGSDDTRSSLSYKLQRILRFRAKEVITTDPYVTSDPSLQPLDKVLEAADLLIIAAPHPEYRDLATDKPVADVWNLLENGNLV